MRRIIKIAVRFLHTKTALCDRKDTQSRFAVNAARSIVCVGTFNIEPGHAIMEVSMPHAALCVSGPRTRKNLPQRVVVSMPHAALCVSGRWTRSIPWKQYLFQCRTQHCVCRDNMSGTHYFRLSPVSMPHAALCVSGLGKVTKNLVSFSFQCRTQHCVCRDPHNTKFGVVSCGFQCRTQHCVCRDTASRSPCPARAEKAFWKDALFCAVFGVCG